MRIGGSDQVLISGVEESDNDCQSQSRRGIRILVDKNAFPQDLEMQLSRGQRLNYGES